MTNAELIAKIKAEIERLKATNPSEYNYQNAEGYVWALGDLLSFLSTLEEDKCYFYCKYGGILPTCSDCKRNLLNSRISKEQVQGWLSPDTHSKRCNSKIQLEEKSEKSMNLEEEINRYLREECSDDDEPSISDTARHFAKWGAEHLADDRKMSPKDLEEAAERFSKNVSNGLYFRDLRVGFIAGAEWQKEQMMKEAVCYIAQPDITATGNIVIPFIRIGYTALSRYGIKVGDKVRIIIVKE